MAQIVNFQTPFEIESVQQADQISNGIRAYSRDQQGRPRGIPGYIAVNLLHALNKHSASLGKIAQEVSAGSNKQMAMLKNSPAIFAFVNDIIKF